MGSFNLPDWMRIGTMNPSEFRPSESRVNTEL